MNRASYQRINPNLSTKQIVKPKQATFCFKTTDGTAFFKIAETTLRSISKYWPEMSTANLLIAMLNGKSFKCGKSIVSIVYK